MTDEKYAAMSSAARLAAAFKADDKPGIYAVAGEIRVGDATEKVLIAQTIRLVQVTEELCWHTGRDPQQLLDEFACDAIAVENGRSITDAV